MKNIESNKSLSSIVSNEEARELLGGIGVTTIWRLGKQGLLRPIRKGSFYLHEIQALMLRNDWQGTPGRKRNGVNK
jgi:hypothetical protein